MLGRLTIYYPFLFRRSKQTLSKRHFICGRILAEEINTRQYPSLFVINVKCELDPFIKND